MELPFFSVIIPTYNSAKTLSVCLDSLVNQTFKNFELIILDGESTDNTVSISIGYTEIFKNIQLLSEKDKGIYDAMNKGIEMSRGNWLYFIGSDDFLINNRVFEEFCKLVDFEKYDYVYGNVISQSDGQKYDGPFDGEKITDKNIPHQALFVKKDLFRRLGKFNIRYKMLADYDFNLRSMFNKKIRKKYVDLVIASYNVSGLSSVVNDELFTRRKNYLILKYGFSSLNWSQRINLCRKIVREAFFPKLES